MVLLAIALLAGCSRTRYRLRADRETYGVLEEKTRCAPWRLPTSFSVYPDPQSRFFDSSCLDDPALPIPAPKLFSYCLPELPARDPRRFRPEVAPQANTPDTNDTRAYPGIQGQSPATEPKPLDSRGELIPLPLVDPADAEQPAASLVAPQLANVRLVSYAESNTNPADSTQLSQTITEPNVMSELTNEFGARDDEQGLRVVPVPGEVWNSLPDTCLSRMLEFSSIRSEYQRSFQRAPASAVRDSSPRLALEDILELALINSREYQSQKEQLYTTALRLTLERYAYDLKFSPFGNGTSLNYEHNRTGGQTVNRLGIPTALQLEKTLASGGDILLRFANNVVLTFNRGAGGLGPGFTSEVSSELIGQFSQALLQRDIVFESLTQSERDVVYAARTFARFRKEFFRDLATQYYQLLLTYRDIEIDAQDYFSNLRGFLQAGAEYRAGRLPRFQVDQFEQDALSSRSRLISSCNNLESSFDRLKLGIGLPPETPINLDLNELELLTLRDETTVARELVRRAQRNLASERLLEEPDDNVLLNGAIDLTRRTIALLDLREQLDGAEDAARGLRQLWAELRVREAMILVNFNREVLDTDNRATPPAPPLRIFQRGMDVIDSQLRVVQRQLDWVALLDIEQSEPPWPTIQRALAELSVRYDDLRAELAQAVEDRDLDRIPVLVSRSVDLLADVDRLAQQTARFVQDVATQSGVGQLFTVEILNRIDEVIATSQRFLDEDTEGLVPIQLDMDDAMLTALVQRFDLMNQRGALADQWREIKLAGDDLRSILNLNAGFEIRTDPTTNQPFNFTFDESRATLGLAFDAPLNRKTQRNDYRRALINYNSALRSLMGLEDAIKVGVRDDLRQLQLDREQYAIAVASAALASERVVSTRLQLRLGVQNVAARDVLESQQAYTASLSAVAREHIGYILDRIELFLDLELLEVDESGFWPELYNDDFEPLPNWQYPVDAGPAYGCLPPYLWYSECMRRMEYVPFGQAEILSCPTQPTATFAANENQANESPPSADPIDTAPAAPNAFESAPEVSDLDYVPGP